MDLGKLGEDSLLQFIKTFKRLLVNDKRRFDLVVGAGDSGQLMVYITRLVYEMLKINMPQTIVAPIYRHADEAETILFDNSQLAADYSDISVSNVQNILFVDDEIGSGNATKGMLDLLIKLIKKSGKVLTYTIIAEDGGFDLKSIQIQNVKIEFISPKTRAENVFNAISYIIPAEYEQPIKNALQYEIKDLNSKQVMNILLNLPIKEFNNGKPRFTFQMHEMAKKLISNLPKLQEGYRSHLKTQVFALI